jgi:hypothetical protein
VFVDETRDKRWARVVYENGTVRTFGKSITGEKGKPRFAVAGIIGKKYTRHRLVARAANLITEAEFLDRKVVVMHKSRREEDSFPNDASSNLAAGTAADNSRDPGRKPKTNGALAIRVVLENTRGEKKHFESVTKAAEYIHVKINTIGRALTGTRKSFIEGEWTATSPDLTELEDAVLVHQTKNTYASRSHPNEFFKKFRDGRRFVPKIFETNCFGYITVGVIGGGAKLLHVQLVKTYYPSAFAAKLSVNPGLVEGDLQVDHIDGDRGNNAIDNLSLVTRTEHSRKHAYAVDLLREDGSVEKTFDCAVDAEREVLGVDGQRILAGNIRQVCDNPAWRTCGRNFKWTNEEFVRKRRAEIGINADARSIEK